MSRRRNYSPDTLATMQRFFSAFDTCSRKGYITNIKKFCLDNGIDPRHLYTQRKDPSRGYFEVSWLISLVNNFAVSPNWLLTGKGTMFIQ